MIIVQTPLRISFLGGGTDFEDYYMEHGGSVLSTAIDKCVFVVLKERFDDAIYVNYSRKEIVDNANKLEHELVRESMKLTGVMNGIEITTLSDIPSSGTGLGSSSSITVGLLNAFHVYRGEPVTTETLAREACRIEIEILKKPIGRQDQYIAAYGNLRFISFSNKGITVEKLNLSPADSRKLNDSLLLFYTGIDRQATTILTEQQANINGNLQILQAITKLTDEGKEAILQGALDDFGEVLHRSWELKKMLASKITNPRIDGLYQVARKAGAIGGKITGAGGGGFLLLYCPNGKQDDVRKALKLKELRFRFEQDGSKTIFNYRRSS